MVWLSTFHEKKTQEIIITGCIFFHVDPKRWFWPKIQKKLLFLACSSERINLFQRCHFLDIFRQFQKSINIACSMSESVTNGCNKNVTPFSGHDDFFKPMILNTVLVKLKIFVKSACLHQRQMWSFSTLVLN